MNRFHAVSMEMMGNAEYLNKKINL